jgi:hypothetical protein
MSSDDNANSTAESDGKFDSELDPDLGVGMEDDVDPQDGIDLDSDVDMARDSDND